VGGEVPVPFVYAPVAAPIPAWFTPLTSSEPGASAGGASGTPPGRCRWLWRVKFAGREVIRADTDGTASGEL
jgi:hypothetical protein